MLVQMAYIRTSSSGKTATRRFFTTTTGAGALLRAVCQGNTLGNPTPNPTLRLIMQLA